MEKTATSEVKNRTVKFAKEELNTMTKEEIKLLQESKLRKQIKYSYENSEYYREKLKDVGVLPGDIKTIEDYRKLPILIDKERERQSQQESLEKYGHPFGLHLSCSPSDLMLTATTSGTTGTPTFTYTFAHQDLHNIAKLSKVIMDYTGVNRGDRLLFNHALGVYATSAFLPAFRKIGILPIDVDVRAGSASILNFAKLTRPNAMMTTPSLAEYLIDKAPEKAGMEVGELNLSAVIVGGEIAIGVPEVKQKIEEAYGCRVYDYIAPLVGTMAFSCDSDEYHGMHCVTPDLDLYPLDLVDPDTKEPLEIYNGVIGEAVCTSLDRVASPMLRFATGDIVQVLTEKCPGCGFKGLRIKIVGRSDDMIIVKGVNVYPGAIKEVISKFVPHVTGEMRVVLEQKPPRVVPPLKIKLEYGENTNSNNLIRLEEKISNQLHHELRINPEFIWCPPGSLEKSMRKTPVFEKNY